MAAQLNKAHDLSVCRTFAVFHDLRSLRLISGGLVQAPACASQRLPPHHEALQT